MTISKRVQVTMSARYKPWLCCAEDDSLPILTGVYLDPGGYMVSADGFCLVAVPCTISTPLGAEGVIIPGILLKQAHEGQDHLSRAQEKPLVLSIDLAARSVEAKVAGGVHRYPLLEGSFPKWRNLIPKKEQAQACGTFTLDVDLARRIREALDTGVVTKAYLSGDKAPALVLGDDGGFGVLMPMYAAPVDSGTLDRIYQLGGEAP